MHLVFQCILQAKQQSDVDTPHYGVWFVLHGVYIFSMSHIIVANEYPRRNPHTCV